MSTVFFAPHNDDETLWGAYSIMKTEADVVVCLRGEIQMMRGEKATPRERENESRNACEWLGVNIFEQWSFSDASPDWPAISEQIRQYADRYDRAFAPVFEEGGHDHHNLIGDLVRAAFDQRTISYYTYLYGGARQGVGCKVEIEDPKWIARKLRALACYESQHFLPSTSPHFTDHPLTEWVDCEC